MPYRAQIDDRGQITRYKDTDTGEVISAQEYERRLMSQYGHYVAPSGLPQMQAVPAQPYAPMVSPYNGGVAPMFNGQPGAPTMVPGAVPGTMTGAHPQAMPGAVPQGMPGAVPGAITGAHPGAMSGAMPGSVPGAVPGAMTGAVAPAAVPPAQPGTNPLIQPGAEMLNGAQVASAGAVPLAAEGEAHALQGKNLRMEGLPTHRAPSTIGTKTHGFLDATSVAILLPTLVLLALIIAAAHKKRLFPWQTIRTFNPPSGLMSPRDYERSFVCPPNLRRHGRMGKRNPQATWTEQDGIVIPFGFLARTHLPVTIPLGRLPNKNMFIVAPSGSGKTTLMRAIMKALLAKPCVMIAMEAKANDPNLDEKRESFRHTVLPEATAAGFDSLYFNPLDQESVHWNPLDLDPTSFASSIVQDVNSLPPEEQHWAERDHGYICGLVKLLKWGAVQVVQEDDSGQVSEVRQLPCNPRGLMRLVNNRRNIVESLRRLKTSQTVDPAELNELTLTLSSIIRTDTDWDKNIQGVRGRLRMFRNEQVLRVTEQSNIDIKQAMHRPTVLIFGAPASLGPDAESLAACFVYQLQQALHTRYGTKSVLPLFAFFDEYQTLNIDLAGRLSAIVRGANGGLAVILQNISQISRNPNSGDPTSAGASELKTLFSNCSLRVCLHNADESTARFFSDEIGKHAVIVPGISDHYESNGFGIFPTSWNRIHSQQVVARVDADSVKRMEKHHALVFLSPAGDPEFGEVKPFMVDLRGIEEIARLHLLHNVTGRQNPPEGEVPADSTEGEGSDPQSPLPGAPGLAAAFARVPQAVLSTSATLLQNATGQGGTPAAPSGSPEPQASPVAGAPASGQAGAPIAANVRPPFPQAAPGMPQAAPGRPGAAPFPLGGPSPAAGVAAAPGQSTAGPIPAPGAPQPQGQPQPRPQSQVQHQPQVQSQPMAASHRGPGTQTGAGSQPAGGGPLAANMRQPATAPSGAGQAGQAPASPGPAGMEAADARLCPHCSKPPGKGRFCIECGKFMGASQPQPVGAGPAPVQPAGSGGARAAGEAGDGPGGEGQGGAQPGQPRPRPAVTSLHADMSKFGLPGGRTGANPPASGSKQRGAGIEF